MKDWKELPDGRKVYSLDGVKSRQTGNNAEFVLIVGGKNIGKTFNVRIDCIRDAIENGRRFVEISRSKDEMQAVAAGYFDRIVKEGIFPGKVFKTDGRCGYWALDVQDAEPDWKICCYFASITLFQRTKRQSSYVDVCNAIFDEFVIDRRDRYHRYVPGEFSILLNMLDSIFRPFPGDGVKRYVYLLGNACDFSCPHLQLLGIDKPPKYGYTFFKNKSVLLHYVEPWDADERRRDTIIGRLLEGSDEGSMVFDNVFDTGPDGDIQAKTAAARFAFGMVFESARFGIWSDLDECLFFVTRKIPKDAKNVYALTKKDGTVDYAVIRKSEDMLQTLVKIFYARGLRYESVGVRESFFRVLDFLGIK